MSTAFREFLQQHAKEHQAEAINGKATIDEWRASIDALFAQIRQWLGESDPEGLIEIEANLQEIREPGLGRYLVPRLDFRAFGKWIGIIPKARRTVSTATLPHKSAPERADGRVDITNELRRFVLLRFRVDGGDVWMIEGLFPSPRENGWSGLDPSAFKSAARPLDQESFERAVMSFIQ